MLQNLVATLYQGTKIMLAKNIFGYILPHTQLLKNKSYSSLETQSFKLTINMTNFKFKFSSNCHWKANHQSTRNEKVLSFLPIFCFLFSTDPKKQLQSVQQGAMYRVCVLRMHPKFGLRLTPDKNFYLQLTVEKMHACCSDTNFTAMVNYKNSETEIQTEII